MKNAARHIFRLVLPLLLVVHLVPLVPGGGAESFRQAGSGSAAPVLLAPASLGQALDAPGGTADSESPERFFKDALRSVHTAPVLGVSHALLPIHSGRSVPWQPGRAPHATRAPPRS